MAFVRITINGDNASIRSPFDAKDIIKSMPERAWDATQRLWVIPAGDVDELKTALQAAGFEVLVITQPSHSRERERADPPPRANGRHGGTWADAMFAALGPELAAKAYKALSRALHPDLGGSTEHMQILNAARDRNGRGR